MVRDCHRKLYQHSTQCPAALRLFLNANPAYWCFVPMTKIEALVDNTNLTKIEEDQLWNYKNPYVVDGEIKEDLRPLSLVRWCVDHVPSPPLPYEFSLRQKLEQYEFFRHRTDQVLSPYVDLYNASIVMACKLLFIYKIRTKFYFFLLF